MLLTQRKNDPIDDCALYYLAGYCVKSVLNRNCTSCCDFTLLYNDQLDTYKHTIQAALIKNVNQDGLVYPSDIIFKFFQECEGPINTALPEFVSKTRLSENLIKLCHIACSSFCFPSCCKTDEKLITKYVQIRLHLYERQILRRNLKFGSKTMAEEIYADLLVGA